jgi:hypothetical protein
MVRLVHAIFFEEAGIVRNVNQSLETIIYLSVINVQNSWKYCLPGI